MLLLLHEGLIDAVGHPENVLPAEGSEDEDTEASQGRNKRLRLGSKVQVKSMTAAGGAQAKSIVRSEYAVQLADWMA